MERGSGKHIKKRELNRHFIMVAVKADIDCGTLDPGL